MASINTLASGKWRVQVRCKGHYLSNSLSLRKDAEMWARRIEREIDLGQKPAPKHKDGIKTVSDLIDLHIADMVEVGKEIGRSKGQSRLTMRETREIEPGRSQSRAGHQVWQATSRRRCRSGGCVSSSKPC